MSNINKQGFKYETKEVLRLIADNASNKEIASELFLSEGTVRNMISHILTKSKPTLPQILGGVPWTRLNLRDRIQAAIIANTFSFLLEPNPGTED